MICSIHATLVSYALLIHFSQHGGLFILTSVYKPLELGSPFLFAHYPHVTNLQDPKTLMGQVLDLSPVFPQKNKSNTITGTIHRALLNPVGHPTLTYSY